MASREVLRMRSSRVSREGPLSIDAVCGARDLQKRQRVDAGSSSGCQIGSSRNARITRSKANGKLSNVASSCDGEAREPSRFA